MTKTLSAIRKTAAGGVLLVAGTVGLAPAAATGAAEAAAHAELALALSPLPVNGESPGYADSGADLAVRVTTDKPRYQRGETVLVTLRNDLSVALYAPPSDDPSFCTGLSVEMLVADEWEMQNGCEQGRPGPASALAAKSEKTEPLTSVLQRTVIQGPYVGQPTAPFVFEGSLRDLPTVDPPKPGAQEREVPQLETPQAVDRDYRRPEKALSPGSYRIRFSFVVGARLGPVRTIYSEAFVITD